ncbi:MAG TPA: M56 family metallopeptidase [Thermoplasmata archaeon]
MGSLEALQAYWSSPGPLEVLTSHLALLGILALAYRQSSRPATRLRFLYSVYGVDLSLWVFLAASFLLCVALSDHVEYEITGVKLAASLSVIGGLVTGTLAVSVLATSRTAREAHLTRLGITGASSSQASESPSIVLSDRPGFFAASSSLYEPIIILSRRLRDVLTPEELDAVVAHETAHLAHRDSRRRLVSTLLSKCLFFDPVSKLVDPAIYRQGELMADEAVASSPARARALTSALRTLGSHCLEAPGGAAIGLRSRTAPLEVRLRHLALCIVG